MWSNFRDVHRLPKLISDRTERIMKCQKFKLVHTRRAESGFSLLEALIVISVLLIASGIFVPKVSSAIRNAVVSNAYDTTLMTIRQAREAAISERRIYVVTFTAPGSITVAPLTAATNTLNISRSLPPEVQYIALTGIPNTATTTPDSLGLGPSTGAICFDVGVTSTGTNTIYFWPDGSSRDANDNMNSGVIYLARPGEVLSSRAVTVWGVSGRIRGWRLAKNSAGVTSWRQQ
jgi:Tfp pilus assembly protein FimT